MSLVFSFINRTNVFHDSTANENTKNKRIVYLDYARVFTVILVVLGHICTYESTARQVIYSFHMPLFFVISGILHKNNEKIEWEKYIRNLICPFFFFIILYILISTVFYILGVFDYNKLNNIDSTEKEIIIIIIEQFKHLLKGLINGSSIPNNPCWFLLSLFELKIINNLIHKLYSKHRILLLIFLLFGITTIKYHYFFIGQAFMALPFFLIGNHFKKTINTYFSKKIHLHLILVALFLTLLLTLINGRVSIFSCNFGNHHWTISMLLFYITGLIGTFAFMAISTHFNESKLVTHIAKELIGVLGLQVFFNLWVKYHIGWMNDNTSFYTPLYLLGACGITYFCYILSSIIRKELPWVMSVR